MTDLELDAILRAQLPPAGNGPWGPMGRIHAAAVAEAAFSGLSGKSTRENLERATTAFLVAADLAAGAVAANPAQFLEGAPTSKRPPGRPRRPDHPLPWEQVTNSPNRFRKGAIQVSVAAWEEGPGWPSLLIPCFATPEAAGWPWFLERRETPAAFPNGFWLPDTAGRRPSLPTDKELLRFLGKNGYALGNHGAATFNQQGSAWNVHEDTLREKWNEYARWDGSPAVRKTRATPKR